MAFVQGKSGDSTTSSNAVTMDASTPAGSLLIVTVCQYWNSNAPGAISSVAVTSESNATNALANKTWDGSNGRTDVYYLVTTATGTKTVTVTFAGTQNSNRVRVDEYDSTYTVLDATNSNSGAGSPATPGSVTASATGLYYLVVTNAGAVDVSPPTNFTQRVDDYNGFELATFDRDATSGAQNPSAAGTTGNWGAAIVTFVGSSTPVVPILMAQYRQRR